MRGRGRRRRSSCRERSSRCRRFGYRCGLVLDRPCGRLASRRLRQVLRHSLARAGRPRTDERLGHQTGWGVERRRPVGRPARGWTVDTPYDLRQSDNGQWPALDGRMLTPVADGGRGRVGQGAPVRAGQQVREAGAGRCEHRDKRHDGQHARRTAVPVDPRPPPQGPYPRPRRQERRRAVALRERQRPRPRQFHQEQRQRINDVTALVTTLRVCRCLSPQQLSSSPTERRRPEQILSRSGCARLAGPDGADTGRP